VRALIVRCAPLDAIDHRCSARRADHGLARALLKSTADMSVAYGAHDVRFLFAPDKLIVS
jgi:hypothetical protein